MPTNPELRRFIVAHFSDTDLDLLIADDFEPYQAEERLGLAMVSRALDLIGYCKRMGLLLRLESALRKRHPRLYQEEFGSLNVAPVEKKPRDPRQCFISHAHQDARFAQRLASDLRDAGVPVWIAPDSIQPGELMVSAIDRGLDESGVFIAVLTPNAHKSKWVRTETQVGLQMWHREELTIIPLMVEECNVSLLSNLLATIHHVSFANGYDAGSRELKRRLGVALTAASPKQVGPIAEIVAPPRKPATPPSTRSSPAADSAAAALTIDDMPMCYVPPGEFIMGGDGPYDGKPEHLQKVEQGFWISKYTVTNAQFKVFVGAGGYKKRGYWTEAIAATRWKEGGFRGWKDEWREGPNQYQEPLGLANHPVVGVSWYEALAFTRWLWERLGIDSFWLPSEAQWEYAARGPRHAPHTVDPLVVAAIALGGVSASQLRDFAAEIERCKTAAENRRVYPWGDDADPKKMNFAKSGIGATSAVGAFPAGVSLFGCEDMSGNVWEWTMTKWTGDYKDYDRKVDNRPPYGSEARRVLRGGAFVDGGNNARCACRGNLSPDGAYNDIGFRVVASPIHL